MRDTAGEFHDVEPALNVAARVRANLPMLGRQQMGKLVHIAFNQFLEPEHDASATLRIERRPCRLRGARVFDSLGEKVRVAERYLRLNLADRRVIDGRHAVASGYRPSAYEVIDGAHNSSC